MDRLAEQVVVWHNRHPLAKRITIYDVHTIGVVALPFMRSGRAEPSVEADELPELIEPVMDEPAAATTAKTSTADDGAPVWGGESTLSPPNPQISASAAELDAHLDALANQEALPPATDTPPRWKFWQRTARAPASTTWPVFSEQFIEGLSLRRIVGLVRAHGFSKRPGDPTWPQRDVAIDDGLISSAHTPAGAWPVEVYLISAAIDAGRTRTRVLVGRKGVRLSRPPIIGRRCLSPSRLGLAALVVLLLAGAATALWWPRHETAAAVAAASETAASVAAASETAASAVAASETAASAASFDPAASAASASEIAVAIPASAAASKPSPAAHEAVAAASSAPTSMPAEAASMPTPDIRPRLVQRVYPPRASEPTRSMLSSVEKPVEKAAEKPAEKPAEKRVEEAIEKAVEPVSTSKTARPPSLGSSNKSVVALVGPASASRAEAEALLGRLRTAVASVQGKSSGSLQSQVFQTPEGWRAAVWPFASRAEAQLINATLVGRGMKTRAVDF